MVKEGFAGSHLMLKVMRRAATAPLDPPKHLGHGHCDTFNKSIQLGVATNNHEVLGKETIGMMRALRIPSGELRGIGLQMGKLERAGEAKVEPGQKKLEFKKSENVLKEPVQELLHPTDVDPIVLANLPDDFRARIISRPTASQIDEDVLKELPLSLQAEIRETYKPKTVTPKKPSPRKVKQERGQSKLPLSSPEVDAAFLAELPSTIREEVLSNARREKALARASKERHQAWAEEKAVRERKVNRSIVIPDPPPKPTFQKMSELEDIRNLITMWFDELREEGPADEDVGLLGSYLRKVVIVEKDLRKAEGVVKWFLLCCETAADEWWATGQRLGEYVNDACTERGVGKINFDIRR
jgi:DNA repair protein REV1 C-terminal domain/Ubiquitin binding region